VYPKLFVSRGRLSPCVQLAFHFSNFFTDNFYRGSSHGILEQEARSNLSILPLIIIDDKRRQKDMYIVKVNKYKKRED
jgi:hypothetical protein